MVWLPSPSFYCFGVPVVDLGCDHAIYFNQCLIHTLFLHTFWWTVGGHNTFMLFIFVPQATFCMFTD